jgi:hypothetical protein
LSVYKAAVESGDFEFLSLVAESGVRCSRCGLADCARFHGRWSRKKVLDLCSGELFRNLSILRARFCSGKTNSLFPGELWRGCATVTSVLELAAHVVAEDLDQALQWSMEAGDGDEAISERTARRWVKRAGERVPIASAFLNFLAPAGQLPASKLIDFIASLDPGRLLEIRRQWGGSLLAVPPRAKPPRTATCPKPVCQSPLPPHDPPSVYLPRGTRSRLHRRGRPPDE